MSCSLVLHGCAAKAQEEVGGGGVNPYNSLVREGSTQKGLR